MLPESTANRVLCVLYSQIIFFGSLICMGLALVIASVVSVSNIYWSCAVLNLYYTVAWLSLATGILQVLLGTGIGVFIYSQPKCAKNKDHLILVGPEGNQLGEIDANQEQGTADHNWTLRISPTHQKSHSRRCSQGEQCCSFCCCGNQSEFVNFTYWFRPIAIIFFLLIAAHVAAIALNASLISQGQNRDLNSEVGLPCRPIFNS
ncbi:hypothetical protein Aperf_G00000110559 [Anoplocephala perfoliata]